MNRKIPALALLALCLFVIPIVGWYVGNYAESNYEAQFHEAVTNKVDGITEDEYLSRKLSYMSICAEKLSDSTDPDINEICGYYKEVKYVKSSSIIAFALGLIIILTIILSSKFAGTNRDRLSLVFGSTIRIVMFILSISILMQGAIFIYSLYTLEATLIGRVHFGIIAGIGIGVMYVCFVLLKYTFSFIKHSNINVKGKALSRTTDNKIYAFVDEIASQLNASPPDNIVVGLEPNFYVTTADTNVIGDIAVKGRTLYISLPLLRLLSIDELKSVVGHELGHFKGDDVKYSMKFAPLYSRLNNAINELSISGNDEGVSDMARMPALFALQYCLVEFATAERTIGRNRELLADNAGSEASSSKSLASALIKVSLFSDNWIELQKSHINMLAEGKTYTNLSTTYAEYCTTMLVDANWEDVISSISESKVAHPIDTHPSLAERFTNLDMQFNDFSANQFVNFSGDAITLLNNPEDIEVNLSNFEAEWLVAIGAVIVPKN